MTDGSNPNMQKKTNKELFNNHLILSNPRKRKTMVSLLMIIMRIKWEIELKKRERR